MLDSTNSGSQTQFWTVSCHVNDCKNAFDTCIDRKCFGKKTCKTIIHEIYPLCSTCVDQLLNKSHYETINRVNYLICDKESELQMKGCMCYCRTEYYSIGECIRLNNIPVCRCSNSDSNETVEIATTTSISSPTLPQICDMIGVKNDVNLTFLTSTCGYSVVYKHAYNFITTKSQLDKIYNTCNKTSIICVGGLDSAQEILLVVSCSNCQKILSLSTEINKPMLINGAYWYYTPGYSFGFSPVFKINQNSADTEDEKNKERISWHLNESSGGWRLGSFVHLNDATNYYKVILKKN